MSGWDEEIRAKIERDDNFLFRRSMMTVGSLPDLSTSLRQHPCIRVNQDLVSVILES